MLLSKDVPILSCNRDMPCSERSTVSARDDVAEVGCNGYGAEALMGKRNISESIASIVTLCKAGVLEVVLTHRLVSGVPTQTLEASIRKVLTRIEILGIPLSEVSSESVILDMEKAGTVRTR